MLKILIVTMLMPKQSQVITIMLMPNFRQNACIALAKCPIIMLMPIIMLQTSAHHAENEADVSMHGKS